MNNYQISLLLHAFMFISDSLFSGLKILIPIVFIIKTFRPFKHTLYLPPLIYSLNLLLLFGGTLFLTTILSDTIMSLNTDYEFGKIMIKNLISGPHWFLFTIPFINYAILPQVMWLRKLRRGIILSFMIVLCWFTSHFILTDLQMTSGIKAVSESFDIKTSIIRYAEKAAVFIISFIIIFVFILRKFREMNSSGK